MSVLKNRHLVIAMLVAPVLAILGYFALDALVGESPMPAEEGQSYPLAEKPNCRYSSGSCGLKNADFELELSIRALGEGLVELSLVSAFPLDGVMVSLAEIDQEDAPPTAMQARSGDGKTWSLDMQRPDPERHRLRLAASADGSIYYGDVATRFTLQQEPAAAGN